MQSTTPQWMFGLGAAILLAGCAAAENKPTTGMKPAAQGQSYAGWYLESAGQGSFQPCGQSQRWRVTASADLRSRAKAFGLQQDTPVYVRLAGAAQGDEIAVSRVEQFGSPTPVRNCAMDGVVIPAPSPTGS